MSNVSDCLRLKISSNNQSLRTLCEKILNIDIKNVILEKSFETLEENDVLKINVQANDKTYSIECKLVDKNIVQTEPFNFSDFDLDLSPLPPDFSDPLLNSVFPDRLVSLRQYFEPPLTESISNELSLRGKNDEVSTQYLTRLVNQNDRIINLLDHINSSNSEILKQNDSIMQNQAKTNQFLEHLSSDFFKATLQLNLDKATNDNRATNVCSSPERQPTVKSEYDPVSNNGDYLGCYSGNITGLCGNIGDNLDEQVNEMNISSQDSYDLTQNSSMNYSLDMLQASTSSKVDLNDSTSPHMKKKKKRDKTDPRETTQKDFNRQMRNYINIYIPYEDHTMGITELCEKYPEKLTEIKGHLKNYLPVGSTFNSAWSKALHSIRQHKYMERKKSN